MEEGDTENEIEIHCGLWYGKEQTAWLTAEYRNISNYKMLIWDLVSNLFIYLFIYN